MSHFAAHGTEVFCTLLASWQRDAQPRHPGCSWLAGGAVPAFVDDHGSLAAVGGFPSGHAETTRALRAAGFEARDPSLTKEASV